MKELMKIWSQFKRTLQDIALGISGVYYRICDISPLEDALGYTSSNKSIHLSNHHPLVEALETLNEKLVFIKGVFAHELMHQLETDFQTFENKVDSLPEHHQKIFATIFNVMEDPAIEFWAPSYFGGPLLSALHYSVKICYKEATPIAPESKPFSQFLAAAIHYGDGGIVKGKFSSTEAEKCFNEALSLFDECITCPDGAKRVDYAYEVFKLTKPLWEEEAESIKKMKELMEELEEMMENAGKSTEAASGDGPSSASKSKGEGGDTETEKKMSRRKTSKGKEEGEEEGSTASEEEGEDTSDTEGESSSSSESEGEEEEAKAPEYASGMHSEGEGGHGIKSGAFDSDPTISDGSIDEDEYELTEADIKAIEKEVEECLKGIEIEDREQEDISSIDLDIPDMAEDYPSKSCINLTIPEMKGGFESQYADIVESISSGISHLTHQIKRILQNDVETREYRQSGRVNIKRLQSSRMTSRVFDRRVAPEDKHDACVMLAVDVSGSMRGSKAHLAKQAAIGLAEVFHNLKIPFKVMTFNADLHVDTGRTSRNYDVCHTHYVNWSDSLAERIKLLNINANSNNFDGYSITYAGKLIGKRKEKHKLLIVISDGQPACCSYYHSDGIADTRNAVKRAKKNARVIGVAIDADSEIIHSFYGPSFVEIKNIDELFERLGTVIGKEIKSW